jgi:voltage-gated sodium channel
VAGLETSRAFVDRAGAAPLVFHTVVQAAFLVEILLRIAAAWPRPRAFFRDGWNVFDLTVVLLSMLPAVGPLATLARLARILRVLRLVSVSPKLRLIVGTMLKSIPALGHVGLLLGVLLYLYGTSGVHLFGAIDPERWGSLGRALLTLFTVLTLEGWTDVMSRVQEVHPWAWIYFASFILIGVYMVVNLLIAVVVKTLEEARDEEELLGLREGRAPDDLAETVRILRSQLGAVEKALRLRAERERQAS